MSSASVCPSVRFRSQQPQQFVGTEAGEVEIEAHLLQARQFERQFVIIPAGQLRGLVVGDAVRLRLRWRQTNGDMHRCLCPPELQRRLVPRVADDDDAVFIDDERLPAAKFLEGRGDGVYGGVVEARIAWIRADAAERAHFDKHGYCS